MRHVQEGLISNSLRAATLAALTTFGIASNAQAQTVPPANCRPLTAEELTSLRTLTPARMACVSPVDLVRNMSAADVQNMSELHVRSLGAAHLIALFQQHQASLDEVSWDSFLDKLTNSQARALSAEFMGRIARARQNRLRFLISDCSVPGRNVDQQRNALETARNIAIDYQAQGRFMDALEIFTALYICRPQATALAYNKARAIIEALGAVGILQSVAGYALDVTNNSTHRQQNTVLANLFNIQVTRSGTMLHFPRDISGMFSGAAQLRANTNNISVAEFVQIVTKLEGAKDELERVLRGGAVTGLVGPELLQAQNSVAVMTAILTFLQRIADQNQITPTPTGPVTSTIGTTPRLTPPLTPPPPTGSQTLTTVRHTSAAFWPIAISAGAGAVTAIATGIGSGVFHGMSEGARNDCISQSTLLPNGGRACPDALYNAIGDNGDMSERLAVTAVASGAVTLGLGVVTYLLRPTTETRVDTVAIQPTSGGAIVTVGGRTR